MTGKPQTLQAADSNGNGLRIEFFWDGDRYAHRIETLRANKASLLLESCEGNDRDRWPASAPLQQLSIEQRPDGCQVALLLGMAGQSHWSASVTATGTDPSLLFEMACRTKDRSALLCSSYRICGDVQRVASSDKLFRWPHLALTTSSATIQSAKSEDVLEVLPAKRKIDGMTTVQWTYELRWLDD